MDAPDDSALIARTLAGDNVAYGDLVQRYQQSVFGVCFRILGERQDAEDAAQEVFVRAYRYLESFDQTRPFGPWIRRVAANYCRDRLKAREPATMPLLEEHDRPLDSGPAGPEQQTITRDRDALVRQAVASLPDHYRAVIELRHFLDFSYDEMAEELGLPLNTVKSHLLRARKILLERLENA